jgi:hypothetical protein
VAGPFASALLPNAAAGEIAWKLASLLARFPARWNHPAEKDRATLICWSKSLLAKSRNFANKDLL